MQSELPANDRRRIIRSPYPADVAPPLSQVHHRNRPRRRNRGSRDRRPHRDRCRSPLLHPVPQQRPEVGGLLAELPVLVGAHTERRNRSIRESRRSCRTTAPRTVDRSRAQSCPPSTVDIAVVDLQRFRRLGLSSEACRRTGGNSDVLTNAASVAAGNSLSLASRSITTDRAAVGPSWHAGFVVARSSATASGLARAHPFLCRFP